MKAAERVVRGAKVNGDNAIEINVRGPKREVNGRSIESFFKRISLTESEKGEIERLGAKHRKRIEDIRPLVGKLIDAEVEVQIDAKKSGTEVKEELRNRIWGNTISEFLENGRDPGGSSASGALSGVAVWAMAIHFGLLQTINRFVQGSLAVVAVVFGSFAAQIASHLYGKASDKKRVGKIIEDIGSEGGRANVKEFVVESAKAIAEMVAQKEGK